MPKEKYSPPSLEEIGSEGQTRGVVALALAAIVAAAVYDGVVLVNYGVAVNVGGGVNVAYKVNAVTG